MQIEGSYFSFVWKPALAQKMLEQEIWTPGTSSESAVYLVHYSVMENAQEFSWVWLFPNIEQMLQLRAIVGLLNEDPNLGPIRAALVPGSTIAVIVDPKWIAGNEGIQEVWIGFNYKKYYADRLLKGSAEAIIPMEEFQKMV